MSPFSSPVMKRVRGEDTPRSSPALGRLPEEESPSEALLRSSPEMPSLRVINLTFNCNFSQFEILQKMSSPDVLATKVHDTRRTLSQQPPRPLPSSQASDTSAKSLPSYIESAMTMNTLRSEAMCGECAWCLRFDGLGITDFEADLGPFNPYFDHYYEKIKLVSYLEKSCKVHFNKFFFSSTVGGDGRVQKFRRQFQC